MVGDGDVGERKGFTWRHPDARYPNTTRVVGDWPVRDEGERRTGRRIDGDVVKDEVGCGLVDVGEEGDWEDSSERVRCKGVKEWKSERRG